MAIAYTMNWTNICENVFFLQNYILLAFIVGGKNPGVKIIFSAATVIVHHYFVVQMFTKSLSNKGISL
jgi:hypothetical protein